MYLENMKHILEKGIERTDRTEVGTISSFGVMMKYNLCDTFPISICHPRTFAKVGGHCFH